MSVLHEGWMILAALIPSIGLLFLFWVILKHLIEGDRRERAAIRRWEEEQDRAQASAASSGVDGQLNSRDSSERPKRDSSGPAEPS